MLLGRALLLKKVAHPRGEEVVPFDWCFDVVFIEYSEHCGAPLCRTNV
jgi:hypothetical protein